MGTGTLLQVSGTESFSVQLGDGGRLTVPAAIRRRLKLRDGEELIVTLRPDGVLCIRSARQMIKATRGLYRVQARQRSLADELIAERRAEATR
jgi:AbrB family looped-hinge helix DNA binding protein